MTRLPIQSVFIVFSVSLASAQSAGLELGGVVLDPSGAAASGAELSLVGPGLVRQASAGADGRFQFTGLPAGGYDLTVSAENLAAQSETIELTESVLDLTIALALEQRRESVEVTASASDAAPRPDDNQDAVEMRQEDLQALPVLDGDVVALLQNLTDDAGFGGDGGGLVVDGLESDKLGVTPSAIQEIRINKDPYSAEYSRPGRNRIEIITKQGESEVHGQVNLRLRNYRFDARDAFAAERAPQSRFAIEGAVTGPIGSGGENSFVFSGEHDRDDSSAVVFAQTPDELVSRAVLTPERETEFSIKYARHASYEKTFSLRFEYESETESNSGVGGFNLPETAADARESEKTLYWNYRRVLGPNRVFEWTGRAGRESESVVSLTDAPRIDVEEAFTGGGAQADQSETEDFVQSAAVYSWQTGRHFLRFGGQLRDFSRVRLEDRGNFGGSFRFSSIDDFVAGRPFAFTRQAGDPALAFWDIEASAFIQDDIRLDSRSTLAVGLRYDRQNFNDDPNNFAPRASLAVALGDERKTTIRVGGGIFYDNVGSGAIRDQLRFDGVRVREVLVRDPGFPDPFAGDAAVASPPPNIVRWSPRLRTPYVAQYGVSVERRVTPDLTLSVNARRMVGAGLLRSRDLNAPRPVSLERPDPDVGILRQLESSARLEGHAVSAQARGKLADFFQGMVRYTWSRNYNDVDGSSSLPANSLDLTREWAPASFDRRHRFDLIGAFDVRNWFQMGANLEIDSGRPFTLTTGTDDNGDGIAADRPTGVRRNTERLPAAAELDLRVSKTFQLPGLGSEPSDLTLAADAFNVLNRVNITRVVGNQSSTLFGLPVSASSARRLQFGARWSF